MRENMKNWTKFEKIWLVTFLTMVLGSTIYFSITGTDYTSWHSILLN
jgi:cell division protein FtsL